MEKTCKEKVKKNWTGRAKELKKFFKDSDYEGLAQYGLSIDKVDAGTFEGQRENYIRYQFSWGGPSDELRIFENGDIEYWFLDWSDGACVDVTEDKTAQQTKDYVMEIVGF